MLLHLESILQNAKQLQYARFLGVVSGLKIIGHGHADNNLELICILIHVLVKVLKERDKDALCLTI
jgi:hypothetical protein